MSQDSPENQPRPQEGAAGDRPESPSEQPPSTPTQDMSQQPPPAGAPPPGARPVPGEEPLEQPLEQPLGTGQPPPPGPPPPGAPSPGAQQAAPRKRRTGLIIVGVVAGVLALLCVGVIALAVFSGGEIPEAGDCLTDSPDPNDMEVVDCGAGDAAWTVLGADRAMTRSDFSGLTEQDQVCQDYPETEQALWVTGARFGVDDNTEGTVVCLQRVGGE